MNKGIKLFFIAIVAAAIGFAIAYFCCRQKQPVVVLPPSYKQSTVQLGDGVGMDLIWIEAGEFEMGTEHSNPDEKPVHPVKISKGFWIGKYEVTQEQWQSIMKQNPSQYKGAHRPVSDVDWGDCQIFIEKLNQRVSEGGFRLPTEAEWEYVCRAGSTTRYHFGDDEPTLKEYAWYRDNSTWGDKKSGPSPVGTKRPNPWGLYDMHGNMWEWCQDWYGENYYSKNPSVDPVGPKEGQLRILRGGSWFSIALDCRSFYRSRYLPTERSEVTGLRVVRSLVEELQSEPSIPKK